MFNDSSSLLAHLSTRRSGKARDMVAPGPDAAQLKDIVALALRTPDHGKLAPWRIVTIGDDQRDAFAALLKQIGRASCRERVSPYVEISGVAVSLKKKKKTIKLKKH